MKLRRDERTQKTITFLFNAITVLILSILFYDIWMKYFLTFAYYYRWGNVALAVLYAFLLVVFNGFYGGFQLGYATTLDLIFSQIIAMLFSDLSLYALSVFASHYVVPVRPLVIYVIEQIAVVILLNILFNKIYYWIFQPRKSLLVYEEKDETLIHRIERYQHNSYNIVKETKFNQIQNQLDDVQEYECIIASGLTPNHKSQLAHVCYEKGKSLYIVPDIYDVFMNASTNVYLVDTPVFRTNNTGTSQLEQMIKRLFDIVFALVFLIITSPIFLISAIVIKCQDHGPVFYKQTRLTKDGKTFEIIKFRSMKVDAESDGKARLASEHDDRITKYGKFIRACRIDELPQLINILKGDMSVVGPRPERPEIANEILKEVPSFNYRLKVKAGLTGYAQVYGKYNTKLSDKLLFDLIYIQNFSILLDIRIMFMTFKILFKKDSTEGVE